MRLWGRPFLAVGVFMAYTVAVCADASDGRPPQSIPHKSSRHGWQAAAIIDIADREMEQAVTLRKKLTANDIETALSLFADSAQEYSAAGLQRKAALAELELGDTYQMISSYQKAIAAYRRSLSLVENEPTPLCMAYSHLARAYASIGRAEDAAEYFDQEVADRCEKIPDKKVLADMWEAEGEANLWSSNKTVAVNLLTSSRQLAIEASDTEGAALSTLLLAQTVNVQNPEQAHRLAWEALQLWLKNQDSYGVARAHLLLAFLTSGEGNFRLAQCHSEDALRVFQRISDQDNVAILQNILGMLARQLGDYEDSVDHYQRARLAFAAIQDDLGEAESITGLADVFTSQHEYRKILPLYSRKLHLAQKTGNLSLLASVWADMAVVYQAQHNYEKAEAYYRSSLAKYRDAENRSGESIALMRLAGLQAEQKKLDEALDLYGQARELKEQDGEIEDLARVQYSMARIYRSGGQLDEARSEIEKTIDIIESQRLRISKFDTRAEYFASVHEYYSLYIQVLMELHHLHPEQKYNELALEAAEKSRVRALLDLLQNSTASPSCDELLARDIDRVAVEATADISAFPSAIPAQPLTLPQIQAEIAGGDSVVLEYALGDDRSYAWLIDGENISQFELASAGEIHRRVRAFRESLMPIASHEGETTLAYLKRRHAAKIGQFNQAKQLAEIVLSPIKLPVQKRLLIVPDGSLQYVPFGALPVLSAGEEAPLIKGHELVMLPSASVLALLRKTAAGKPPPTNGIAVFADPVFEMNRSPSSASGAGNDMLSRSRDLTRVLRDVPGWQHIPSLPGSRAEALAILQIAGPEHTRLALGFDANRQSILNGWVSSYRVLHFATHGIVDTLHPEMSGLILSLLDAHGKPQNGYLRLSDIYNLKLSADLVVLSSCESALGKDLASEGTIGLPRGFLYAGARSVIASLWRADDEATAVLMKALYLRLQHGENTSASLHGAQLELSKDDRFSDPYYWAGFVLEGDFK
jgi:CHAT domain-containing protein